MLEANGTGNFGTGRLGRYHENNLANILGYNRKFILLRGALALVKNQQSRLTTRNEHRYETVHWKDQTAALRRAMSDCDPLNPDKDNFSLEVVSSNLLQKEQILQDTTMRAMFQQRYDLFKRFSGWQLNENSEGLEYDNYDFPEINSKSQVYYVRLTKNSTDGSRIRLTMRVLKGPLSSGGLMIANEFNGTIKEQNVLDKNANYAEVTRVVMEKIDANGLSNLCTNRDYLRTLKACSRAIEPFFRGKLPEIVGESITKQTTRGVLFETYSSVYGILLSKMPGLNTKELGSNTYQSIDPKTQETKDETVTAYLFPFPEALG